MTDSLRFSPSNFLICQKAVECWGVGAQIKKVVEETTELNHELLHSDFELKKLNGLERNKLMGEVVDVQIMLLQLIEMIDNCEHSLFSEIFDDKIKTLDGRIERAYNPTIGVALRDVKAGQILTKNDIAIGFDLKEFEEIEGGRQ